mmetsp:Transcript_238/g.728  ORF Transcript_238/g.728 Transcript_238/m.728 type:complete len:256 (-) Transcript_238:162-929(-)|eukprot:scaffold20728_cov132-Isochrysis_galbana.AAC.3
MRTRAGCRGAPPDPHRCRRRDQRRRAAAAGQAHRGAQGRGDSPAPAAASSCRRRRAGPCHADDSAGDVLTKHVKVLGHIDLEVADRANGQHRNEGTEGEGEHQRAQPVGHVPMTMRRLHCTEEAQRLVANLADLPTDFWVLGVAPGPELGLLRTARGRCGRLDVPAVVGHVGRVDAEVQRIVGGPFVRELALPWLALAKGRREGDRAAEADAMIAPAAINEARVDRRRRRTRHVRGRRWRWRRAVHHRRTPAYAG